MQAQSDNRLVHGTGLNPELDYYVSYSQDTKDREPLLAFLDGIPIAGGSKDASDLVTQSTVWLQLLLLLWATPAFRVEEEGANFEQ